VLTAIRANSVRESLPYSFVVHAYSNLSLQARSYQVSLKLGSTVGVLASLNEYDVPLMREASVWAEVTQPDQSTFGLTLQKTSQGSYAGDFSTTIREFTRVESEPKGLPLRGTRYAREKTVRHKLRVMRLPLD
jgi:hypothetical protein